MSTYWTKFTTRRVSRRRALAVGGASAAAAAFLAACGSDDDEAPAAPTGATGAASTTGSTGATGGTTGAAATGATGGATGATSGLLTQPVDNYSSAVRGGVLKDFTNAEPNSLDPINPQADLNNLTAEVYSTLFTEKPGKLGPAAYVLQGDLAASFEVAPDGLTITAKLRPNAKWHYRSPVNGRAVDAEDVVFSLNRHAEKAPLRDLVWNAVSGGGFALTPTAPDNLTVVIPLAEPVAYAVNWFAGFGSYTGQILMYPKETDSTFDIRQDQIGTGPLQLKEHVPSVRFVYERNPDYWDQDFMLLDGIEMPIIPEYAARVAQLTAGQIHTTDNRQNDVGRAEDILTIKNDAPDLLLYQSEFTPSTSVMTFGWLPVGDNPYQDERVRRAISMAVDRDLDVEVRYNVAEFEAQGLPVLTYWNSHLTARESYVSGGWFLDPQGSDFGPNAQYFQFNLEEAKKMLAAAGYPDGFDVKFGYPNAPQFNRKAVVEPFFFYLQELGLNIIDNGYEDYTQGYIPLDRDASGEFEGIGYHSVTGTIPSVVSPTSAMVAEHLPSSGVTFHGYSADGSGNKSGDPEVIEILEKAKLEQNVEARKALVIEAQRVIAGQMWSLTEPGGASGFLLAWPAVQGLMVNRGESPWDRYQIWLDQTKAPFA
jgi:peptide/nickel transport system substrate-binding protein